MPDLRSVLIMAGGTGGHVFPGLAVAKLLKAEGIAVNWLGTHKGLESRLVPEAGIPIHYISISGVRGKGLQDILLAPWRLSKAIYQSLRIIKQLKPDVVIGMGGFVSGPGGIASWLLGIPLIVHEQNAKPGTTNKWLAKVAKRVLEAFPNTFLNRAKTLTVGNPVRAEIVNLPEPKLRKKEFDAKLKLLVVGGSLGAQAINQLMPRALALLDETQRPQVHHQTGEKLFTAAAQAYSEAGVTDVEIQPFIVDMAQAYAWADIVLCRAGALTVSELCAAGVGAILVPYPHAVDDHQTANAKFMLENDAAYLIPQSELTPEKLAKLLKELNTTRERCFSMAQSAYNSRKIDATENVLRICREICH